MFKDFIKSYRQLPDSNRSMIYLMWIYTAGGIISGIFINIYVFKIAGKILDVINYNLVFLFMTFIGFSIVGYLLSILRKDVKIMYYLSYISFIISFLLIFVFSGYLGIFSFAFLYGLGNGMFRCAVHAQELVNIKDKNRDNYSSFISSGDNIIKIIVPLLISVIFYLSYNYFNFSGYVILFLILPIIYLISFIFIKNIGSYIPSKLKTKDVINFFNLKKYLFGQMYIFFVGFYQSLMWTLSPLIAYILLKSEVNIGIFEGLMSFLSTFLVVFIANKRNINNRLKIMGIISMLLFINYSLFVLNFNLFGYIIFTLLLLILGPLYRVSEHVYDLKIMDSIKYSGSDFFPSMLLREFSLLLGRYSSLLILLYIYYLGFSVDNILKIGLMLISLFLIFAWIAIYLHMKFENKEDNEIV